MNIADIKQKIPISEFLKREGFMPVRRSGRELVYRSPYRNDKHPSFTVSDEKGFWYDHGDARGGNIIDLATLLYQTTVKDALSRINSLFDGGNPEPLMIRTENRPDYPEYRPKHIIQKLKPLGSNMAIASYLQERGIYEEAVKSGRIKEIYYEHINAEGGRRRYFGAGWKNESGGYDVRSKYAKICINRKDVLIMKGHTGKVNLFEGMLNFLSALKEKAVSLHDTNFVLNSLGLYQKGIKYLLDCQPVEANLFLDNGEGGDKFTKRFMEEIPIAVDKRHLYSEYGDYNEKIMADINTSNIRYSR